MGQDREVCHFYYVNAYETNDGLKAFPLCGKFEDINANSRAIFRDGDDECFYRYKQIMQVLEYNRMDNSTNIFEAVFNNPENFIDITTIAKLKKRLILLNPTANPLLEILKMKDWPNKNAKIKNMQNNMTKH